jgi:hypothetical protein
VVHDLKKRFLYCLHLAAHKARPFWRGLLGHVRRAKAFLAGSYYCASGFFGFSRGRGKPFQRRPLGPVLKDNVRQGIKALVSLLSPRFVANTFGRFARVVKSWLAQRGFLPGRPQVLILMAAIMVFGVRHGFWPLEAASGSTPLLPVLSQITPIDVPKPHGGATASVRLVDTAGVRANNSGQQPCLCLRAFCHSGFSAAAKASAIDLGQHRDAARSGQDKASQVSCALCKGGQEIKIVIPARRSLQAMIENAGFVKPDAALFSKGVTAVFGKPALAAGKTITLFGRCGRIQRVEVGTGFSSYVVLACGPGGQLVKRQQRDPVQVRLMLATGPVGHNFLKALRDQGVDPSVAFSVVRVLGQGRIHWRSFAGPRAEFGVMFKEAVNQRTQQRALVQMCMARFCKGQTQKAFYYYKTPGSRKCQLYTAHGVMCAVEQNSHFCKPIAGGKISSPFGMRIHPIEGRRKMHNGIDFSAPRGTPVLATNSGLVERVGTCGGFGRCVRIRHGNGFSSVYGHLDRYRKGIRPGMPVATGQVIGYVGSTGHATGPHLHFEILQQGRAINPTAKLKPNSSFAKSLMGKDRVVFQRHVQGLDRVYHQLIR